VVAALADLKFGVYDSYPPIFTTIQLFLFASLFAQENAVLARINSWSSNES